MASLVPDFNYTPNTSAASNAYVAAQNKFSESLMDPINFLAKMNSDAIAQKRYDEEKAIKAEELGWKREDRARTEQERQAYDSFLGEFAKGRQAKVDGILNRTDILEESKKYDLTPEEIEKSKIYGLDVDKMRAAGENTLADKTAWQVNLSNTADAVSSNDAFRESRSDMYDRIAGKLQSEGKILPKELIASMDAARLADETTRLAKIKDTKEDITKLIDKKNELDKWTVGSQPGVASGGLTIDPETGVVTTGVSSKGSKGTAGVSDANINNGLLAIQEQINKSGLSAEQKKVAFNEAKTLFVEKASEMDPATLGKLISGELGTKTNGTFLGLSIPFVSEKVGKIDKATLNTIFETAKEVDKNTPDRVGATAGGTGTGAIPFGSTKSGMALKLNEAQSSSLKDQLLALEAEKTKLNMTPDELRDASLTALLKKNGVLPSADTSAIKSGNKTNLNAANPDAVVTPTVNKNIKKIDGIPDSLVASEGVTNKAYKLEGEKHYTVGMGYNLGYNNIDNDFKAANIPVWKAELAKNNPEKLILDDGEASRLAQVSYYSRVEELDKSLGGKFADLSPEMQATAMQMKFRGDLDDSSHGKAFSKLIAANDYDGLTRYIVANAGSLPEPIVTRFNNDLGMPNKTKVLDGKAMTESERNKYLDNLNKTLDKNTDSSVPIAKPDPKGLSIADTVKVSELKPSNEIKKDIDMLNYSLQKYSNIDEIPKSELDTLKVLSDNYSLALKNERINKASKDPFYKNFNWGRKPVEYGKYNLSDEEKRLRAIKESPNSATEDTGIEDMSATFIPLGRFAKGLKSTSYDKDILDAVRANTKVSTKANTAADGLTVDQTILQDIFGKYSPNVQGVNRTARITKDEIVAEMNKLRDLKNPSKYDLQELQRLNELLGRFIKKPASTKAEF